MSAATPTLNPDEKPTRVRWLVFTLACGTSWFLYVHRYTWNIIRPELEKEYGFSNTQLETLGSAFYASYTIFQIPSGIVADFFGPHIFLGVIIILWAVSLPLLGFTPNLRALWGIRFLFGTAQAGGYPALGNVTRTWFPPSVRTPVQGWVASFFGRCGGAMSPILMSTILMGWFGLGWRWALITLSVFGVLFAVAFLVQFRNSPNSDPRVNQPERELIAAGGSTSDGPRRLLPIRVALRNTTLRLLVVQQFFNAGADVAYTNLTGSYFASKGIDKAALGILVSLPLWGGALGGLFSGYLNNWMIRVTGSRRWGRALVAMSGKILAAALLFFAVRQSTPLTVALGLFVVKFFADWSQPTIWGTCTDLGGRYSGTVFSINNTSGNLGAMLIPLIIIGPMLDYFSEMTTVAGEQVRITNFTPMFVLMGGLYLLSGMIWIWIDCTKPIEPDASDSGA